MTNVQIKPPNFTGYQKDIVTSPTRFTITQAGTKTGKTFSHIYWLFKQAHTYRVAEGHNYWWVAPVHAQAKIAFNRMWKKCGKTGLYSRNKTDKTITTPYKTVLQFKSAKDPDNLYGEDVYSAVYDEFTRGLRESWFALRSTLTATKAPCKFVGNFIGSSNWGHQLYEEKKTDEEWAVFMVTTMMAVEAGIIEMEEIEQARKDLPKFIFDALYMCTGDIDEARMIDVDAIQDLRSNDHVDPPDKTTGKYLCKKYITADIAMEGSDKFVIGIWAGWRLIHVIVVPKCKPDKIEEMLRGLAVKHNIPMSRVAYDADGLGQYLEGYLKKAKPFHNGAAPYPVKNQKLEFKNRKAQCYYHFAQKCNDAGFHISADVDEHWPDIVEELEVVKNRNFGIEGKFMVLKKEEIKKLIGRSPDFTDMMMMRSSFDLAKQYTGKYPTL